ncbi:MAG: hypothetical protein ACKO4Z_14540 [Planctomycetota bacterium]
MKATLPAIVMTCQRYMPIAGHMIDRYAAHWPDHPFRFRLPDGRAARDLARTHCGRLELVPTDEGEGRGRFRAAVFGLLSGIPDDAWVYWCIDDKYVAWLDRPIARAVVDLVGSITDPRVAGLSFARARHLDPPPGGDRERFSCGGVSFDRRRDYRQIWLHQLLRAGVLRTLFGGFPDRLDSAKQMDALHRAASLPDDQRLYVLDRNAVVFGESTTRGRLTANCAASMRRGRGVPPGFEVDGTTLVIGRRPSRLTTLMHRFRALRSASGLPIHAGRG